MAGRSLRLSSEPLAAWASVLARICYKVLNDKKQSLQIWSGGLEASSAEGLALPQPESVCESTAALLNGDCGGRLAAGGQDREKHWQAVLS